ncbi:hypothetical protein MesoLjLc_23000 [Mesorhizobium sp. L-8-10]|uniref:PRC-barrel domain-containing protein n=1 Tax=Mesorhizobium sp. L-8-10 TaxID=2744523 RepID=UPI00192971B8|nr:PRC-barrel domain-containing protein [Mesorhizobium sp. L-8-10]BCH30370.1 hypothetical protein MesoLjLc_23000 [Mesorhizobium sp. L-8-10]
MNRHLFATTAVAVLLATGAYAQDATQPAPTQAPAEIQPADPAMPAATVKADGQIATNIIGETVYDGTGDDAQNIGDVNDIVIGQDGKAEAVVIGVGGFLGIGEKNVAWDYSDMDWAEKDGDRWIVITATKEELEALPAFDRKAYDPAAAPSTAGDTTAMAPSADAPSTTAPADDAMKPAPAQDAQAPSTQTDMTTTAAVDKSQLKEVQPGDLSAEKDLVGTTVYGAEDANVGEIGDVVLTQNGKVDAVIVDVGGFLGVGEKPVAIGMDNLVFMTDADGNKYLYTNFTEEQLNAAPAYDESTWAEKRDDQRMTVTR